MTYDPGDQVTIQAVFSNSAGSPTNPTSVTLTVTAPDGTATTPTPTSVAPSTYTYLLTLAQSGMYRYSWAWTGSTMPDIQSGMFSVKAIPATIPMPNGLDLCSLYDVKDYLSMDMNDEKYDYRLGRIITSVSSYFIRKTGMTNPDGSLPSISIFHARQSFNEYYDGNGNCRLFVRFSPVISVQALKIFGVSVPESLTDTTFGWVIDQNGRSIVIRGSGPRYGYQRSFAPGVFTQGIQNVNVQYTAGFTRPPDDLVEAAIRTVGVGFRRIKHDDIKSNHSDVLGTTAYWDWALDPTTKDVLANYTRKAMV